MEKDIELTNEAEEIDREETLYGFPVRKEDGRRSSGKRVYDIQRLWSRHKEILNLDSLGYKGSEIAKILNIDPQTVSNTLNSTLGEGVQLAIREDRDKEYQEMRKAVMELTWKSLQVYEDILDSEVESAKLNS